MNVADSSDGLQRAMFIQSYKNGRRVGQSGFTLIETAVTVAIAATLATVAIPNYLQWSANQALKDSATDLKGDLQIARIMAIKTGFPAVVEFNKPEAGRYLVFLENGEAGAPNGSWDVGEALLGYAGEQISTGTATTTTSRALAKGISFHATTTAVKAIGFGSSGRRSLPSGGAPANITLQYVTGTSTKQTRTVQVLAVGEVNVQTR